MYTDNKIRNIAEITNEGAQSPFSAFYVFLAPKSTSSPTTAVMNGTISLSDGNVNFPIAVGYWNPIVVNKIDVTSTDLTNYRIFVGTE